MATYKKRKPQDIYGTLLNPTQQGTTFQSATDPLKDTSGGVNFEKALLELKGYDEIRPETRKALATIRDQTAESIRHRTSAVQSLHEKRGTEGSSMEQIGTQQAITEGERMGAERELPFLMSGLEHSQELQKMRGGAYLTLAGENIQNQRTLASMNQEELTSIRNMLENDKDRELQQYLGELGIQVGKDQIAMAKDMAKREQKTALWQTGIMTAAFLAPF